MLTWTATQRAAIEEVLEQYPPESNGCAPAARAVIGVAAEVDERARGLLIEPEGFAIYVQPKKGPSDWLHHVTTEALNHCLDVLTGPEGHLRDSYLSTYFEYPEALTVRPVGEDEWDEL